MVVSYSIFGIWYGPSIFHLHGRKLRNYKATDTGTKMNSAGLVSKYTMNSVSVFNDITDINKIFKV